MSDDQLSPAWTMAMRKRDREDKFDSSIETHVDIEKNEMKVRCK